MRIEKTVEVRRNAGEVFEYLRFTKNQDNFSVWNMTDPSMKKEYSGRDGSVGFVYKWDSANKNVGAGEQETTSITDGKRVDFGLRFLRPMQNTGFSSYIISDLGNGRTKVEWIFNSPSKFPMSLFSPIFRKILGKDLEKGLDNLKALLEK